MSRERYSQLPYLHVSLVPHPHPHLHLHPCWYAHTHPLIGGGNRRVEEAAEVAVAAAVMTTVAASVVVPAVALLFSPKGDTSLVGAAERGMS